MQYELYIDVFFLVNFMMDYILLMLLRKMLVCSAVHVRVILGAAAGAVLTCVIIAVPIPYALVKLLLLHGAVNVIMLKLGLCIPWGRPFLKAFFFLYAGGFLLGGIMFFLRQYVRIGSLFFILALLGYFLAAGIWSLMEALIRYNRTHCAAELYRGDKRLCTKVLIDTGNRLRDERTGKPVSVIEPGAARTLGFSECGNIRYISYHTIGKAKGTLPLFEIDRMCLARGREKTEVHKPLLAVCGEEMGSDDYQMILNPDIFWRD